MVTVQLVRWRTANLRVEGSNLCQVISLTEGLTVCLPRGKFTVPGTECILSAHERSLKYLL